MIVEIQVTKIERSNKNSRIEYIEGRFIRALALCHSGKYLYQDKNPIYEGSDSENTLNLL
jgi:hypothetical protein